LKCNAGYVNIFRLQLFAAFNFSHELLFAGSSVTSVTEQSVLRCSIILLCVRLENYKTIDEFDLAGGWMVYFSSLVHSPIVTRRSHSYQRWL